MKKISNEERVEKLEPFTRNGWIYLKDRDAIKKKFIFVNFVEAFGWMSKAALLAEKMDHHPEWYNVFKIVEVTLTTHDANGLSNLDLILAEKLDALT
jgi:4a-hydroxytetrahydrobiopterin dehydratase|tara:strand:- start:213 stop:503 length:291 start_codon:yes stop_codon:yes gene_type:complete